MGQEEDLTIEWNPVGHSIDWLGAAERTYFIEWCTDLKNDQWAFFPIIRSGEGNLISHGFYSSSTKFFLRLKWTDAADGGDPNLADFDGDGWPSLFELETLLTDPLERDSDGNGDWDGSESADGDRFSDAWEMLYFGNLTTVSDADFDVDFDGDGISNGIEAQMRSDPQRDQTGDAATREEYVYSSTGQLEGVSGDKIMTYDFDDEGNLQSAQ